MKNNLSNTKKMNQNMMKFLVLLCANMKSYSPGSLSKPSKRKAPERLSNFNQLRNKKNCLLFKTFAPRKFTPKNLLQKGQALAFLQNCLLQPKNKNFKPISMFRYSVPRKSKLRKITKGLRSQAAYKKKRELNQETEAL